MKKFITVCTVFTTILIILFPGVCSSYAKNAVEMCINILIPSIFPFMVCSKLIDSLGLSDLLSRYAQKIMRPLFKINGNGALALIMGILSGYPIGAMICCSMYSQGKLSKNEAHRLLMFTNNSGPLFIISAVGIGLFKNLQIGVILYISHILSALTVGLAMRFFSDNTTASSIGITTRKTNITSVIPESITSILSLCGYVIFFSVICGLAEHIKLTAALENILTFMKFNINDARLLSKGILEITTAIFSSKGASLMCISAIISLGGISVFFQTASFCRQSSLSLKPYISGKMLCGGFSALYTKILLIFSPCDTAVFSADVFTKKHAFAPYPLVYSLILTLFFILICLFYRGFKATNRFSFRHKV